jgi:simple sugar transport system permease protein/ribose transport system permease protein
VTIPPSTPAAELPGRELSQRLRTIDRRRLVVPVVVAIGVAIVLLVGGITTDAFLTVDNILVVVRAASITGIVAIGMTFITLSGNFVSLSVEQTAIMSAVAFALAYSNGWGIAAAIVVALGLAAVLGLLQGAIVALGLNPIVTTLGAGAAIFGITSIVVENKTIQLGNEGAEWLGVGRPGGIPNQSIAFVALALVSMILLVKTRFGRTISLIGANPHTAAASGIRIPRATIWAFVISAVTAGMVGVFTAAQVGQAKTTMFGNLTIDAVAAVLVGGTAIQGGEGSTVRTALGAVFIALLANLMLLRGYDFGMRLLIEGIIVCVAVSGFHLLRSRST